MISSDYNWNKYSFKVSIFHVWSARLTGLCLLYRGTVRVLVPLFILASTSLECKLDYGLTHFYGFWVLEKIVSA